jgi:hypothetical protein
MAEPEHQVAITPPQKSVADARIKDMPVNLTPEAHIKIFGATDSR